MALHSTLTGADLHESKGVDSAPANTVYLANGAGSGTWTQVPASAIDTTTIKNLNKDFITVTIRDIATPSVLVVPIAVNCTLTNAMSCITGAISGGDALLTLTRAGSSTIGTITIAASGSGEGILDTITTPTNNVFTAPSYLKIACDGAPTGGTSDATLIIELTLN